MRPFHPFLIAFVSLLLYASCTKDALPEPISPPCENVTPTYDVDIRPIIEASCAYSGCHLGGSQGLYNNYEGLRSDLENGQFRQRVIVRKNDPNLGMPPDYAPDDRPQDLTEEALLLIECWLDAGYPES